MAALVLAEAGAVETEQGVEVALERVHVRSSANVVTPFEAVRRLADVLAESRAGCSQDLVPGAALESENRVSGGAEDTTFEGARPAAATGDQSPTKTSCGIAERAPRSTLGGGRLVAVADQSERIAVSVPEQPEHAKRPP